MKKQRWSPPSPGPWLRCCKCGDLEQPDLEPATTLIDTMIDTKKNLGRKIVCQLTLDEGPVVPDLR